MSMEILRYAGVIFIVLWMIALLKKNSEMGIGLIIAASLLMLEMMTRTFSKLLQVFQTISVAAGLSSESVLTMIKIIGTGFIADFCAKLCKDQGLEALAFQIETIGKILILIESIPVLQNLIGYITDILEL